jgi:hypothetical protein
MKGANKLRLIVAALLFVGWIGWLAYLVSITRDPVILSRPQLLVSDLCIVAEVGEEKGSPAAEVTVRKVVWYGDAKDKDLSRITVVDLPSLGLEQGFEGPREYIIPLRKIGTKKAMYVVTALPPSPGYIPPPGSSDKRIYPATPDALRQLEEFPGAVK